MMMMPLLPSKPSISVRSWFKRLFAFVVASTDAGTALAANGINFVDENQSRGCSLWPS